MKTIRNKKILKTEPSFYQENLSLTKINGYLGKKAIIFFCTLSIFIFSLLPQLTHCQDIITETDILWESGEIHVITKLEMPDRQTNLTATRLEMTEYMNQKLTDISLESFKSIYVDSITTLGEAITNNVNKLSKFDSMNLEKNRASSNMDRKLNTIINLYKYDIYSDIIPLLISHQKPKPIPLEINYTSTARFSGIVIYAGDELPCYGENIQARLNPAIFPKVYTENMELIIAESMMYPEFLSKWGMVQYTDDFSEKEFEHRIGLYPFRTTAQAIFGNNKTDLLLTEEAAAKILFLEENRELIKQGRILIILPRQSFSTNE